MRSLLSTVRRRILIAISTLGQRRPNLRDSFDLVVSGLRARPGAGVGGDLSPAGRAAGRVFGFLTSVVLAALSWYEVAARIAWRGVLTDPVPHPWPPEVPHRAVVMGAAWALVACACVAGLRRVAALGAVFGSVGYAVTAGRGYHLSAGYLISSWWLLTLTAFAAACLVTLIRSARVVGEAGPENTEPSTEAHDPGADASDRAASGAGGWRGVLRRDSDGVRPLGWRAVVALTAVALLTVVEPFLARALAVVEPVRNGGWMVSSRLPTVALPGFGNQYGDGHHLGVVLLVVTLVVLALRLRPAVRRRVLLLSAPVAATVLLVEAGFQAFMASSPRNVWPPADLTVGQCAALVLTPLLVLTAGTWLLHRYEQNLASGVPLA